MAAPTGAELAAIEARLRSILVPYESRLETASIYGIPTLRRAGAKAHDWFAFVKAETKHVSFYLLPMVTYPELMADVSPALARRRTGKSMLRFTTADEALFEELEGVVARAYGRYTGAA
jgi:hypothetical protein